MTEINGIENMININWFSCHHNDITSLKGIEYCTKLKTIFCNNNQLKNLDELLNLPNLLFVECHDNDWDYPLPTEFIDKLFIRNMYSDENVKYFRTYECQQKFLEKYPERIKELEQFGIHEKIKEEFADLIEGNEFGFFGLK